MIPVLKNATRYTPELLCGAVALLLRLWLLSWFVHSPLFVPLDGGHDRTLYLHAAIEVANGHLFPPGAFEHLPLYPWLLGLIYVLLPATPATAALFGILCDTLTTLLLVSLARRLGASPPWAILAGLIYAAYPLAIVYSTLTMPNTLNALGLTLFAFLASSPALLTLRRSAGLGALAGLIALGFAGMLTIAAAWMIYQLIASPRRHLLPVLIFLITLALPLLPPALHNTRAEGQFVLLTTHGGFNLYMGNHPRATGYPLRVENFRMTAKAMLEDAHHHAENQTGLSLSRAQSSAWWADQAKTFWRESPRHALQLTLKKIALFWNHRDMDDLRIREQIAIMEQRLTSRAWPGFAVISFLGLIGLLFTRRATPAKLISLAGIGGLILFFITARYRLTFAPLLLALGAAGSTRLSEAVRQRAYAKLLALLPLLIFIFWPFEVRDQRPIDHYNAALQLLAADQPERALDIVQRGLAIAPHFANLHHAEGSIWFRRGDFNAAARSFANALHHGDALPNTPYNLALSLARAERYCEAFHVLDADPALRSRDPLSARLHTELAPFCDN